MTKPEYTILSNDEKTAIVESTIRSLEYQMYQAELQIIAEKAKNNPDTARIEVIEQEIAEKQKQIAAVKA